MMPQEIDALERELTLLGRAAVYPATPPIARAVGRRLAQRPVASRPAPAWSLAGALLAGLFVTLAVLIGTVAPARQAVADLFDKINIFATTQSPEGLPREISGTEASLAEAERSLDTKLRLPTYPEQVPLKRVLVQEFGPVKVAVMFFSLPDGRSFALFETNASAGKGVPAIGKGIPANGVRVVAVSGLGDEAYWLEGLRITQYYDAQGNVIPESLRATDVNTLLWSEFGFVYRLEGDLSQDEAVRIARSLR